MWLPVLFNLLLSIQEHGSPPPVRVLDPRFDHVVMIVLENTGYDEAMKQPFLSRLCHEGACATDMHAESHPSQPNYIAMIGASTLGVTGDGSKNITAPTIADLLEAQGYTWATFAEGYPGNCYLKSSKGKYARKHEPFISFTAIQSDPARCAHIESADHFDPHALAHYTLYVPDLNNDGHDTGIAYADRYLAKMWAPLLADPTFTRGLLLIVTVDENDGSSGNQIYTAFWGPNVKPGAIITEHINHVSLLKMIENEWNLGSLSREDVTAVNISSPWIF